jgi:hypothetical protein
MTEPDTPAVTNVNAGDVVSMQTKNPVTTWRFWGLLVLIVGLVCDVAMQRGWIDAADRDGILNVLPHVAEVVGLVMAGVGAWKAKRPLGTGNTWTQPTKV